jgi:nucleotide-binding universal stress UspA family protein
MKKVIIAFDGKRFSQGAFEFVKNLNQTQPVLVTGVFLPVVDYAELLYSLGGMSGPLYVKDVWEEDEKEIERNIKHFERLCLKNGIEYRIHPNLERHIVSHLKNETRYADLLVLSSELFYENLGKTGQEEYLTEVIHRSECPVILVPEQYSFPKSVILSYDGSASSARAIKQFTYLFPELTSLNTILVYASEQTDDIPDKENIEELAGRHFDKLTVSKIDVDPRKYFDAWLADIENPILVAGAYGRSRLSEFIHKSFIREVIKDHKLPVFITHD